MARKRTKRRGGGKKKALLSTVETVYSPDNREEMRKAIVDALLVNQETYLVIDAEVVDLETYLAKTEEAVKAILKAHNLPTTWQEIRPHTNDYDLDSINASYAADILYSVHEVREFITIDDAHSAAAAGIKLGGYIACNDAEFAAGDRESGRTSKARNTNAAPAKVRRARMKAIAEESFNWKPGAYLTKQQNREVKRKFIMELDPIDRPTSAVLSADALKIGFRKKK